MDIFTGFQKNKFARVQKLVGKFFYVPSVLFEKHNFFLVWKISAEEEEGVIQFICFPKTNDSGLRAAW